ncbi:MAG TPA: hypothetical protein VJ804_15630, partial [Acidimicrobiales bacterium]|nr:hypothetical protein [Acidimicrobiales bacterium]
MGRSRPDRKALRERNEARCRRILETAEPLRLDDLDWAAVGAVELEPDVVDVLVYMRDVEGFTDRDLVGLTAHRTTLADPIIRRFLDLWRAEESVHCQAVGMFLGRYAEARGVDLPPRQMPPPA